MSSTAPLSYRATLQEYQQQVQVLFEALKVHDQAAEWRFKWEHPFQCALWATWNPNIAWLNVLSGTLT
jgi:hypothetical protein